MNLFLRLITLLIRTRLDGRKIGFFDESRLKYRVWITDQDAFQHMNNGRYLSITDLSVIDFLIRTGVYSGMRKRGWIPVVVHKEIAIHSILKFPQAYEVVSFLEGWTDKYICIRHKFMREGILTADSLSIGRVRGQRGSNPDVQELIDTLELGLDFSKSPALPQDCLERIAKLEAAREAYAAAKVAL